MSKFLVQENTLLFTAIFLYIPYITFVKDYKTVFQLPWFLLIF